MLTILKVTPKYLLLCSALAVVFFSCKVEKKPIPPYFQGGSTEEVETIAIQVPQVSRIQKDDVLGITVSSLNRESNDILNFSNLNSLPVSALPSGGGGSQPIGYPVDSSGNIAMAYIGKINVVGLTLEEAQEKIRKALVEGFLKEPAVNIRFMNHKFVVLGEVTRVGSYNLLDDRTTIIDALATAGDLTPFAKRDELMIIRSLNEKREVAHINLLNREIFTSPYFYVRNGDVIYAEPIPEKQLPAQPDERLRNLQVFTTVLSALAFVLSIILRF